MPVPWVFKIHQQHRLAKYLDLRQLKIRRGRGQGIRHSPHRHEGQSVNCAGLAAWQRSR